MDESRKLLEEEIQKTIERISSLTPGSEERAAAIEELSSLYKLKTEESKVLEDAKVRNDQLSDQKDGAYTSTTFRGLFSKFKPTKK